MENDKKESAPNGGDINTLIKGLGDKVDGLKDKFVTLESAEKLNKSVNELTQEMKDVKASITTKDKELEHPLLGLFKSPDEFWIALLSSNGTGQHGLPREQAQKLLNGENGYVSRVKAMLEKSTTGFNEAQDADGGLFLIPQIASGLMVTPAKLSNFASQVRSFPISGVTYEMNALVDKNHSTSIAGGITVSRFGEGVSPTKSKAAFEKVTWKVSKQGGYTDITEEALADIPALAGLIPGLFQRAFDAADERDFLYQGLGAGEPVAALSASNPSLVTVAKETGQAADTIVLENILKMRSRCVDYGSAYWYATQDMIPQLATILNGNVPIFLASGTSDVPDTILGRPVIYTEYAAALGDLNDLALVSPKHYGIANRQGVTSQSSIHVRFLQGETTLRFVKRNDGQPLWKSVLTPVNGNTRSPFVNLAAR
jgi:HK97 family phage major capsid protein